MKGILNAGGEKHPEQKHCVSWLNDWKCPVGQPFAQSQIAQSKARSIIKKLIFSLIWIAFCEPVGLSIG